MAFYEDPSFFLLLVAAIVPAAVLGILEKPLKAYGLVVSCLFLCGLFMDNWAGLGLVAAYVLMTYVSTRWVLSVVVRRGTPGLLAKVIGLVCAIGPLVTYKVTVSAGGGLLGFVGISYITFKATQVLLEVEDGLIRELPLVDYLSFLLFFPVFTSGPIDRSRRFTEDVNEVKPRGEYLDLLGRGILMLVVGAVMQMVLATAFKKLYDPVALNWSNPVPPQVWSAIVTSYEYGFYLYFDFAGYSLMAQGVSYCLGVRCPSNFNLPFVSCTLEEFWDRWHITLSHWLRDYVFMRLERTLARKRIPKKRDSRAAVGLIANMVLMGAWHGLSPQYLLYGLYHGVLLAVGEVLKKRWKFYRRHRNDPAVKVVSWFVTINVVMFGFALFSGQLFTFLGIG